MSTRLPVRIRLTIAFGVVMAVVLLAAGMFVYQRLESNLDNGIRSALGSRSADVTALAQQSDTGLDRRQTERDRQEERHHEEQSGLEEVLEEERDQSAPQDPVLQHRRVE